MNTGHIWSEQEKQDLLELPQLEFTLRYPEIGFNAYRHKKRDLTQVGTAEPIQVRPAEGYIGPTMWFFDFETTFSTQPRMLSAAYADGFGNVTSFTLKGESGESTLECEAGCSHRVTTIVAAGKAWIDDHLLAVRVRDALEIPTSIAGWNSRLFDIPVLNGRLAFHRERPIRVQTHKDMMWLASGQFMKIGKRSLASVSEFFSSPHQKTPLSPSLWDRADHGDDEAYALIVEHNVADVLITRDVFAHLEPHVVNLHR